MSRPPYMLHTNLTPGQSIDFAREFMTIFGDDVRRAHEAQQQQPADPTKKPATVLPFRTSRRPAAPVRSANPMTKEVTCSPSTCPSPISVD